MESNKQPGPPKTDWLAPLRRLRGVFLALCVLFFLFRSIVSSISYYPRYLPEWMPLPGVLGRLVVLYACPAILLPVTLIAIIDLARQNQSIVTRKRAAILTPIIVLVVVALSVAAPSIAGHAIANLVSQYTVSFWGFEIDQDRSLIAFAASRYDPVIDAIKAYEMDHGERPPSLEALVPDYLRSVPSIYMRGGKDLMYKPVPEGYYLRGPFAFELLFPTQLGLYSESASMLKFCPETYHDCPFRSGGSDGPDGWRIDDRWIFVTLKWETDWWWG